jgi:hypothetical protein
LTDKIADVKVVKSYFIDHCMQCCVQHRGIMGKILWTIVCVCSTYTNTSNTRHIVSKKKKKVIDWSSKYTFYQKLAYNLTSN